MASARPRVVIAATMSSAPKSPDRVKPETRATYLARIRPVVNQGASRELASHARGLLEPDREDLVTR